MNIKYRIPVICQNGHKAFWYCQISNSGIAEHTFNKNSGVPREMNCNCPKHALGEGWKRNGENQVFVIKDFNGKEIYEGDMIRSYDSQGYEIIHHILYDKEEAKFRAYIVPLSEYEIDIVSDISFRWIHEFQKEVIGSSYLGWENE